MTHQLWSQGSEAEHRRHTCIWTSPGDASRGLGPARKPLRYNPAQLHPAKPGTKLAASISGSRREPASSRAAPRGLQERSRGAPPSPNLGCGCRRAAGSYQSSGWHIGFSCHKDPGTLTSRRFTLGIDSCLAAGGSTQTEAWGGTWAHPAPALFHGWSSGPGNSSACSALCPQCCLESRHFWRESSHFWLLCLLSWEATSCFKFPSVLPVLWYGVWLGSARASLPGVVRGKSMTRTDSSGCMSPKPQRQCECPLPLGGGSARSHPESRPLLCKTP